MSSVLPLDDEDPNRSSNDDDEITLVERRRTKARILIADDDEAMRLLVATTLVAEGYEVHEAESGNELLRTWELIAIGGLPAGGVDLVVLDLKMPGMDGLELLRELRARRSFVPAILMTAFPEPETRIEAERLGAAVLSKPFALELLTTTALSILHK